MPVLSARLRIEVEHFSIYREVGGNCRLLYSDRKKVNEPQKIIGKVWCYPYTVYVARITPASKILILVIN